MFLKRLFVLFIVLEFIQELLILKGVTNINNYHVILVSHGAMAEATLKSSQMIIGESRNISAIGLYESMGPDDLMKGIKEIILSSSLREVIIVSDLIGGTPQNTAVKLLATGDCKAVINGLSLPIVILLETVYQDFEDLSFIDDLVSEAKENIANMLLPTKSMFDEEDE